MEFLSPRQLQGLKAYQYRAGGYTVLDDLHNPVWNWLVNRLPMWLAPNLITLMASFCILAAYLVNVVYLPGFTGDAPAWVYILTAISVVAYVNLDCMDGKQARRTGSSSPLGQLFDHGLDALVLHMMLGNIASSLSVSCSLKMAAGCMGILAPWILAQWEEYHTGIMMYGTRYYGVMEANYSICLVHLLTAWCGPGMWRMGLPISSPLHPWLGSQISIADLSLVAVSSAGVAQGLHNVSRVLFTVQPAPLLDAKEAGDKDLGRGAAIRHLTGLVVVLGLGSVLLHQADGQGALHARLAFLTFGVAYALMASQLIVAHMCKGPQSPPWLPGGLLAAGVVANIVAQRTQLPQLMVVAVIAAVTVTCYLVYVLSVVSQISSFLGIEVLRIQGQTKPSPAPVKVSHRPPSPGSLGPSPTSPVSPDTSSDDDLTDAISVIPAAAGMVAGAAGLSKRKAASQI